ncbi:MAG: hypothetical protein BMS9Abin02_2173 [Anaerolineae bacterium]|nr:MAG: hypothetical protein BMS9Abin02_2173 [Anaerolineae bacterium]
MSPHNSAAWEIHTFLTAIGVPYAIIGGTAVLHWGEPRFTQDIDLTVQSPLEDLAGFVRKIIQQFTPRLDNALEFALLNRVILVSASNGYPLDISLGLPGYEDVVMERGVGVELGPGKVVKICSAEDLIIHKAVAGRAQDVRDIEGIVYRQRGSLDADYIRKWLKEFSDVTGDSGLIELFERPWQVVAGKP